jgi:hypothetical protein
LVFILRWHLPWPADRQGAQAALQLPFEFIQKRGAGQGAAGLSVAAQFLKPEKSGSSNTRHIGYLITGTSEISYKILEEIGTKSRTKDKRNF